MRRALVYLLQLDSVAQESQSGVCQKQNYSPGSARPGRAVFQYEPVCSEGLPPPCPDLLLHLSSSMFPFPVYFPSLHNLLDNLHKIQWNMQQIQLQSDVPLSEKGPLLKTLAKDRVNLLSRYVNRKMHRLGPEGLNLVIPYVIELFEDQWTNVHAAWMLFNPVATALGPKETNKQLLSHLINLMNAEQTTVKHIKLYHRSFVMQVSKKQGRHISVEAARRVGWCFSGAPQK